MINGIIVHSQCLIQRLNNAFPTKVSKHSEKSPLILLALKVSKYSLTWRLIKINKFSSLVGQRQPFQMSSFPAKSMRPARGLRVRPSRPLLDANLRGAKSQVPSLSHRWAQPIIAVAYSFQHCFFLSFRFYLFWYWLRGFLSRCGSLL